jgi:hypothetical protein
MKRVRATKRTMESMTRVACNKEGNGGATATRVMVTAKANNNQPATGATKAGGGWQESVNEAITRPRRYATTNNESMWQMIMAATKRAMVERAMVTAMRVAGKEEGKGDEEEDGVVTRVACNEEGDGNGCKSNGNEGDGEQAQPTNTKRRGNVLLQKQ